MPATSPAEERAALVSWGFERVAVTAIFLANGLGIGGWAASILGLKTALLLSDGRLSLALFGFAAGAVVSMPLAGLLGERIGTARAVRATGLLFAVALVLPSLAGTLPVLVLVAFVLGAANGGLDVSMNAHASDVERRGGRPIMSSFHAAFSIGGLLGAVLGGIWGARAGPILDIAALGSILLIAFSWRGLRGSAPAAGTSFALPSRTLLALSGAAALCMVSEGAIGDWSAVYLATVTMANAAQSAGGYAAFSVGMVAGRLAGDAAVTGLGRRSVLVWGAVLAASGLALSTASASLWPSILGFALVGLGLANVVPAVFSAAGRATGSPATGIAMAATAGYAGFLLGPPIIGALADAAGLRLAITLLILAALGVAVIGSRVRGD